MQVVDQPELLEDVGLREVDRARPVVVREHVHDHQLALVEVVARQLDIDRVDDQILVLLGDDARTQDVLLVDGQHERLRGEVVARRTVRQLHLGALVVAGEELDGFARLHRTVHALVDGYVVVAVPVFAARQGEGHAGGFVGPGLHLVDVPFAAQIARVHDAHVGAQAVDLLVEPQREGVVVAVVEDDRVGKRRLQVVPADVVGVGAARTVVVVPVLGAENARHHETDDGRRHGGRAVVALGEADDEVLERHHPEPDPHGEGVERSGVNVVAFARFAGRGVEVDHQCDTHHHEERQHDQEVLRVAVELVDQPDEAQDEG